jgi:ABC-type multidrug transport system fused ATPase/permease subunit/GT2 family glycosyltransferase
VSGKFFYVGGSKLYLRGVTYGTFRPIEGGESGSEYGRPEQVEQDFLVMARDGINAVRLYTVPPIWLLDLALRHKLYVMVGIPWEQHIAFLDSRHRRTDIEKQIRRGVRACACHPALLCYAIGNEIPASLVRWYGHRRVERFLHRLYRAAKEEDPGGLVTYVNFPTTEYLDLPFLDFVSYNVYLEEQDRLEAYLARLQNLAGDRPLVMAEIGLDSSHNGMERQAQTLSWQVETAFQGGCAGAFIFAWTDEWHRGGEDVEDWDFGLTDRNRTPKPALDAVRKSFEGVPFPGGVKWPSISVVVCSHNGARTLRDCCEGLLELKYDLFEVIVVDDGSSDATAGIAEEYGFRAIRTPWRGLSSARNTGLEAAQGEIVAYIDDDARPDPHWLHYLAHTFLSTDYVGVGGPNIVPSQSGPIPWCVENSPGGPIHVLLNDREAEHIPGCNMAFRKSALMRVGGFDPRFRAAGDDVDICWKLQAQGMKLGFNPAAVVWHHRRSSVRAYWRQQVGYGRAEALLERKWPEKYNAAGHISWTGRLYGSGLAQTLGGHERSGGGRIYGGVWGSAPFQSVYGPPAGGVLVLTSMPEWYVLIALLALLSLLGNFWSPLLLALPLLFVAIAIPFAQAVLGGARSRFPMDLNAHSRAKRATLRVLIFYLHLIQPLARLIGRATYGLTPLRKQHATKALLFAPWPHSMAVWRESWQAPEAWLEYVEGMIKKHGGVVQRGGDFGNWDLETRGGIFGSARLLMGMEEHGAGRQLARFRIWPRVERSALWALSIFAALAAGAAFGGAPVAAYCLGIMSLLIAGRILYECATAVSTLSLGVKESPGVQVEASGKTARPRPYRLLLTYAVPLWKGWLIILALTILSTVFSLLQPWPMKVLVDNVLGTQTLTGWPGDLASYLPGANTRVGLLVWVAVGSLAVFLGAGLIDALLTYRWVVSGQGMVYRLARDLFARIQRRSLLFHSRTPVGDSLSRVTTDAWAVHTAADNLLFAPAHAAITAAAVILVMLPMNPLLTLLSLAVTPFMVASALIFGSRIRGASRARRRIESKMLSHVQRTMSSISVVQAFTRENHEQSRFKEFTRASIRAQQRSALVGRLYGLWSGLVTALGLAVILWAGAHEVLAGRLTVGGLLVFVAYLGTLQSQLKTFASIYKTMQEAAGSVERVTEVLSTKDEVTSKPNARPLLLDEGRESAFRSSKDEGGTCVPSSKGSVRLRNVTFGYERGRPVLRDVSLEIEPGQTVGVVGPTGAGKSTLAGLIARLYDPWQGSVEIDGHDIRDVELESVRAAVGLTFQEPFLLPATVAENIRYGRPTATRDEIEAAARAAVAHSFIERLPQGYDTVLGERGATLSGGERQRLSIVRAILKNAPILVLDEPTGALDAETERSLIESLGRLRGSGGKGGTTLIIAHRLSTVRHADKIVVIEAGRLVEEGTHDELMARRGLYAHLHDLQSGQDAKRVNVPRTDGDPSKKTPPVPSPDYGAHGHDYTEGAAR